jgi:broad specificity phosphatase PhoE
VCVTGAGGWPDALRLAGDEAVLPAGTRLVDEARPGRLCFLLLEGTAAAEAAGQRVCELSAGAFVGAADPAGWPRPARGVTVRLLTPSRVFVADAGRLAALIRSDATAAAVWREVRTAAGLTSPALATARDGGPVMMGRMGELILLRHGETPWSRDHKHTGRTDVPLTAAGEAAAAALAPALAARPVRAAFASPASRAARTAELAGLTGARPDPGLQEWDYGGYEGMTTEQIRAQRPGWYLWRDGVIPGGALHPGEKLSEVGARADAVLGRVAPMLPQGDVALVSHGHMLRVLTARWLRLDPADGRLFHLDTGTMCILGTEHGEPVIISWNVLPRLPVPGRGGQPADQRG